MELSCVSDVFRVVKSEKYSGRYLARIIKWFISNNASHAQTRRSVCENKKSRSILYPCLRAIIYDRRFMATAKVSCDFYSEIKRFIFISCNQLASKKHSADTSTEFRLSLPLIFPPIDIPSNFYKYFHLLSFLFLRFIYRFYLRILKHFRSIFHSSIFSPIHISICIINFWKYFRVFYSFAISRSSKLSTFIHFETIA